MKKILLWLVVMVLASVYITTAIAVDSSKVQSLIDQQARQVERIGVLESQLDVVKAKLDFEIVELNYNTETATLISSSEYTTDTGETINIKVYQDTISGINLIVLEYPDGHLVYEYQNSDGHTTKIVTETDGKIITKYIDPETGNTKTITEYNGETTIEYSYQDGSTAFKETIKPDGSIVTEYTPDGSILTEYYPGYATLTIEKDASGNVISKSILEWGDSPGEPEFTEIVFENGEIVSITTMDFSASDNTLTTTITSTGEEIREISTTPGIPQGAGGSTSYEIVKSDGPGYPTTICVDVVVENTCSVTGMSEFALEEECYTVWIGGVY